MASIISVAIVVHVVGRRVRIAGEEVGDVLRRVVDVLRGVAAVELRVEPGLRLLLGDVGLGVAETEAIGALVLVEQRLQRGVDPVGRR